MTPLLVVTDLDGSLLDHHSYDYHAAIPALVRLRQLDIPVVFNSSKTSMEMLQLRRTLNNQAPFIYENGAALALPRRPGQAAKVTAYAIPRSEILAALGQLELRHGYHYRGFSSMAVSELVELTGLGPAQAQLALNREYSEPLLWQDSETALTSFASQLEKQDIRVVRGGRFVHVSGKADKGSCMADLRQWYSDCYGQAATLLALGDGANDLPLLKAADIAVQIRSPVFDFPAFTHPQLIRTKLFGPAGWNAAVLGVLDSLP